MRFVFPLLLLLAGCAPFSFPSLPKPPERHFFQSETETREPRYVLIDGKMYQVLDKVERTYDVGLEQKEPKIPGWKRVLNALFGWSLIGGILVVVLTVLGVPAIPMLLLAIRRIRATNKHLTQIVGGVDKGLGVLSPEQQEAFKNELSKTYDTDTKKVVSSMKGV